MHLDAGGETIAAMFHPAERDSGTAVLFCPPFGWEHLCSFRARVKWAEWLAAEGRPALRFDLPATGESTGSPRDPARIESWTTSIAAAADWLRGVTGCGRLAIIGIGLGGMLAVRGAQSGAEIDDFVLWSVPATGKRLVRELRAFARLNAVIPDDDDPTSGQPHVLEDGSLEVGGYLLSRETLTGLMGMDLTDGSLPPRDGRRALLLGRDGIAADDKLRGYLAAQDVKVESAPGRGYSGLMAHPQETKLPTKAMETVSRWLGEGDPVTGKRTASAPSTRDAVSIPHPLGDFAERPLVIPQSYGNLYGVVAEPSAGDRAGCVILLNAGALRRTGPGRLWVDLSRRWAARGVAALRIDLEAIGDSGGRGDPYPTPALYSDKFIAQVSSVMDHLQDAGYASRFTLAGLCSGAFWSFQTALVDPRVRAAIMINPRALFWDQSLEDARSRRIVARTLERSSWRRVLTGEIPLHRATATLNSALQSRLHSRRLVRDERERNARIITALDRLRDSGCDLTMVFGQDEPLRLELEEAGILGDLERWPNLDFRTLPGRDHTLRPIASQQRLAELLDGTLERLR